LSKISIFVQNFNFCPKFRFLEISAINRSAINPKHRELLTEIFYAKFSAVRLDTLIFLEGSPFLPSR